MMFRVLFGLVVAGIAGFIGFVQFTKPVVCTSSAGFHDGSGRYSSFVRLILEFDEAYREKSDFWVWITRLQIQNKAESTTRKELATQLAWAVLSKNMELARLLLREGAVPGLSDFPILLQEAKGALDVELERLLESHNTFEMERRRTFSELRMNQLPVSEAEDSTGRGNLAMDLKLVEARLHGVENLCRAARTAGSGLVKAMKAELRGHLVAMETEMAFTIARRVVRIGEETVSERPVSQSEIVEIQENVETYRTGVERLIKGCGSGENR